MGCNLPGFSVHGIFSGKSTGVGCHFHLQGIFLNQGSNPGPSEDPHCRLPSEPPWKNLLQKHNLKASILWWSTFFIVQLSHPYMTTGTTIALTRWTFVGKVMSLLFNMLSRWVITFLPRSKRLLNSWLQSPSAVILGPKKTKWVVGLVQFSIL